MTWTFVHSTGGTGQSWETASFNIGDYLDPTSDMRVRFSVKDDFDASLVEAGIDNVSLEVLDCPTPCPGDLDSSGAIDVDDLLDVLSLYGTDDESGDVDGSGVVDVNDVLVIISAWGEC